MNTKTSKLNRSLCSLAAALCIASLAPATSAQCWDNPALTRFAEQIAVQHFPQLVNRMPAMLECSAEDFPAGVGGDYTSGLHRIRIPVWQRSQPDVKATVAHELAHAAVALSGDGDASYNGHGTAFYRELIRAGFGGEAHRVAFHYGNTGALVQAGGQTNLPPGHGLNGDYRGQGSVAGGAPQIPPPPARWVTVCWDRPASFAVYIQHLRSFQMTTVLQRTCQQVLQ